MSESQQNRLPYEGGLSAPRRRQNHAVHRRAKSANTVWLAKEASRSRHRELWPPPIFLHRDSSPPASPRRNQVEDHIGQPMSLLEKLLAQHFRPELDVCRQVGKESNADFLPQHRDCLTNSFTTRVSCFCLTASLGDVIISSSQLGAGASGVSDGVAHA